MAIATDKNKYKSALDPFHLMHHHHTIRYTSDYGHLANPQHNTTQWHKDGKREGKNQEEPHLVQNECWP